MLRDTPSTIQVFLLYYVLPFYGARLPAEQVGVLALAAFGNSSFAEVIRAGIDAVPAGQLESARAIGMSDLQATRQILLPQNLPIILPLLKNQMLSLIKEFAILSAITVQEMTMTAIRVQGETCRPLEPVIMIALLYWALSPQTICGFRQPYSAHGGQRRGCAKHLMPKRHPTRWWRTRSHFCSTDLVQ